MPDRIDISKLPDSKLFERDCEEWDEAYIQEVEKRIARAREKLEAVRKAIGGGA